MVGLDLLPLLPTQYRWGVDECDALHVLRDARFEDEGALHIARSPHPRTARGEVAEVIDNLVESMLTALGVELTAVIDESSSGPSGFGSLARGYGAAAGKGLRMDEDLVPNDPGWRPVVRKILPWVIVPGGIGRLSRDGDGQPPVFAARAVFLSLVMALVMFLVVLMFILPLSSGEDASTGVYLLLAAGPLSVAFVPWAKRRLLSSCGSRGELAGHYATSFFLGIAFAELAALLGFVAAFFAEAVWPYVIGMLVSFVGFWLIAPTASRIRRLDESLSSRGCTESLRAALYTPNGAGTGA